jgi:hypothetical protein
LAEALKDTEASPDPLAADVMDNHVAVLAAVQAQPVCVSMVIGVPAPPDAATDVVSGLTVYEQVVVVVPAAWFTDTVSSPIVSVPLRAAPLLDATPNVTVPLPVPLVRPLSEIHDAFELADQSHDEAVVTEIELLFAPDAGNVTSLGETVMLHVVGEVGGGIGTGTPACCVTFKVWSATTIDAERAVVPAFDAIV